MYTNKQLKKLPINTEVKIIKSVPAEGGELHLCLVENVPHWIHSRDLSDGKTDVVVEAKKKKR